MQYQNRIVYGTDFYAFPKDEKWEENYKRRTNFVRQFLETDGEHLYIDKTFRGVKMEESLRQKLYYENAMRELGEPKKIDLNYLQNKAEMLLKKGDHKDKFAQTDLEFILKNL